MHYHRSLGTFTAYKRGFMFEYIIEMWVIVWFFFCTLAIRGNSLIRFIQLVIFVYTHKLFLNRKCEDRYTKKTDSKEMMKHKMKIRMIKKEKHFH